MGLAVKTYQSDIFNNWINTEWIDGENGINAITAVDVSEGKLELDTLILAKKVYNMLNRIAISGGTYNDWIETVYTTDYVSRSEIPEYQGGMSSEIQFQEVVSNSATEEEPLGTLAGRGINVGKKGGDITVKTQYNAHQHERYVPSIFGSGRLTLNQRCQMLLLRISQQCYC